ncbi:MAG: GerMN domain-containing protein [Hamadaea sp.]|nr:GerMN domain-containing protein [Hamadaea sp.]
MMRRLLLPAVLVLFTAGCGISAEDHPRPMPAPQLPTPATTRATAATSGSVLETLYFVRDGTLIAVTRKVPVHPSVTTLIADLAAGPSDQERGNGLTSALQGTDVVASVQIVDGLAAVELASAPAGAGRSDEALVYAQLVCTLTSRPDIRGVMFTRGGSSVGVPRGDGSLSQGPLTAGDYASLIGSR